MILRLAAKEKRNYGTGPRNVVLFAANQRPRPKPKLGGGAFKWEATQPFLCGYMSSDAIDKTLVAADKGYAGSTKDHEYISTTGPVGALNSQKLGPELGGRVCNSPATAPK